KNQLLRVFDWQGAKHDRIQQAEDGGVSANAQRERGERNDGDSRMAKQRAGSVRDVLSKAFEPIPSPCHMAGLLEVRRIAKFSLCGGAGRVRRQACRDLLLPPKLDVELHLLIKLSLEPATVQQHVQSSQDFAGHANTGIVNLCQSSKALPSKQYVR